MNLVQAERTQFEPQQAPGIDRSGKSKTVTRNGHKSKRTKEAFGADEHEALTASATAGVDSFAGQRKAEACSLRVGIDRKRAEEEEFGAGLYTPDATDANDLGCIVQRHARQRLLMARAAFAHALAGFGEAPRAESAVEHPLDARGVLRLFGDDNVGQPNPQLRRERIRRSMERVNAPSVRFGLR